MKMAQFYNPKNAMNQHENQLKLNSLFKKIDQIKTRSNIILTQTTDSNHSKHKINGSPRKETNYNQKRQMELHDLCLRKIYNKNIKKSFDHNLSPQLAQNLCITRKMKQEQINQENTLIGLRLEKIRRAFPKANSVLLPKI